VFSGGKNVVSLWWNAWLLWCFDGAFLQLKTCQIIRLYFLDFPFWELVFVKPQGPEAKTTATADPLSGMTTRKAMTTATATTLATAGV
jgi:hypothetical protein